MYYLLTEESWEAVPSNFHSFIPDNIVRAPKELVWLNIEPTVTCSFLHSQLGTVMIKGCSVQLLSGKHSRI